MGCSTSCHAPLDLESALRQRPSTTAARKGRRSLNLTREESSDTEQEGSLPKQALGRELSSMIWDAAPRDHLHYLQDTVPLKAAWSKRVQREWRILARGLPDDIHLHLYADRMDIMRAVLVGPRSTPYADALLFFDIHLSVDYPAVPPNLKFWSFGERLNPNLYESGVVCLSLLGTWAGSGSEVWCPRKSTVLQVLVSILGLVLVEEPYFNEPGFEKTQGLAQADMQARQYNERARLMALRSMLRISQSPPGGFEDFVTQHFAEHCGAIVSRAEQLIEAGSAQQQPPPPPLPSAPLGLAGVHQQQPPPPAPPPSVPPSGVHTCADEKHLDGINPSATSEGFRRELAKLLPTLKAVQLKLLAEQAASAGSAGAAGGAAPGPGDGGNRLHARARGKLEQEERAALDILLGPATLSNTMLAAGA